MTVPGYIMQPAAILHPSYTFSPHTTPSLFFNSSILTFIQTLSSRFTSRILHHPRLPGSIFITHGDDAEDHNQVPGAKSLSLTQRRSNLLVGWSSAKQINNVTISAAPDF